jgi:AcrR family transcriptional regulator
VRARTGTAESGARTFTESARRKQIVQAAVETIAEHGFGGTSFSKIAQQAGLSSVGMISYYFAGKRELLNEVVASVLGAAKEHVGPRLAEQRSSRETLRTYIEATLEFMASHRAEAIALIEISLGMRTSGAGSDTYADIERLSLDLLVDLLSTGQSQGEFADFDPWVIAVAIRGAINNAVRCSVIDADVDLARYGHDLADMFDRAVQAS